MLNGSKMHRLLNKPGRLLNMAGLALPNRIKMHRLHKLLLIACLVLLIQPLRSQSFTEVDSGTYQLYVEKNWVELIRTGRAALKQDIDYYYLRMRIGIAYYEKKNYKSAQSHFRKALEFSEGDPLALEYLYYSYLFVRQTQQAALVYKGFTDSLKEKIPDPGQEAVEGLSVEYLNDRSFTDDLIADPDLFTGLPTGVQILGRSYHNLNIRLHHFMHPGTSFIHAYTYLNKSNFYYYNDGLNRFGVDGQKVSQHQYYLSPSFTSGGGLVISPAFHFLRVAYEVPYFSSGGPGAGGGNSAKFINEYLSQIVGGLNLTKYQGPFRFRLGALYSNLNHARQFTGSARLRWYPLGNLDLYMGASLNAHMEDAGEGGTELIPDFMLGYGIASKVWIEISGAYGEMKNYSELNGYIIYNGTDWMKYKAIGNIVVPLTEKGSVIYAGARFAQYESRFIPFEPAQPEDLNIINYNSISIFGGLSWKF